MQTLIPHFIQQQFLEQNSSGEFTAFTLFVDIYGFTSMTQALINEGGNEGAEILSEILNRTFQPMVQEVYQWGGFIPHFAGDGFACIFPVNTTNREANQRLFQVLNCTLNIHHLFQQYGDQATKFGTFNLEVKSGLGFGTVNWGIIGINTISESDAHKFYFKGDAINRSTLAEKFAGRDQVVISRSFANHLSATEHGIEMQEVNKNFFLLTKHRIPSLQKPSLPPLPHIQKKVASRFLPTDLLYSNLQGEFRTVITVFIAFENIDTHQQIDTFASLVLKHIIRYGGDFKEIDYDYNGGCIVCFFGMPVSHEQDLARALSFILAVKNEISHFHSLQTINIKSGITTGNVYAGIVGGAERCQYAALGNEVNLAARLMSQAKPNQILVSEPVARHPGFDFSFEGYVNYKGFESDIPTCSLLDIKASSDDRIFSNILVGREQELAFLIEKTAFLFGNLPVNENESQIAYLYGEAGIGKSRLAFSLKEYLTQQQNINWFYCPADQVLKKSFNPFKAFLHQYFRQSISAPNKENKQQFEQQFAQLTAILQQTIDSDTNKHTEGLPILEELLRTRSILAGQLGLHYPDSLWNNLDAKGRYQNTIYALATFFKASSLVKPTIIELEDSHRFDADSEAVIQYLTHQLSAFPVFVLCTARYKKDGQKPVFDLAVAPLQIDLNYLNREDMLEFAELQLGAPVTPDLVNIFYEKTHGNPFFALQLLTYFIENDLLTYENDKWAAKATATSQLPSNISALLVSRIDKLPHDVKEIVKVAAVIGKIFDVKLLSRLMGRDIGHELYLAQQEQIWSINENGMGNFTHTMLRDTSYELQLHAHLRLMHKQIALAIQKEYAEKIPEKYADIAFHFEKAEEVEPAMAFLEKAGDFAADNYQNQQAISQYIRLLHYVTTRPSIPFALFLSCCKKTAGVFSLTGKWEEAQQLYKEAISRSSNHPLSTDGLKELAAIHLALGKLMMLKGNTNKARHHISLSFAIAQNNKFTRLYAQSLHQLGLIQFKLGKTGKARKKLKKAMKIYRKKQHLPGIAAVNSDLSIMIKSKEKLSKIIRLQKESLDILQNLDDKTAMAELLNKMGDLQVQIGDFKEALRLYRRSLSISKQTGHKAGMVDAMDKLGSAYNSSGDFDNALHQYQKALPILEELGYKSRWSLNIANIGSIYYQQGKYDIALDYYRRSLQIAQKIKDSHGQGQFLRNIGHALQMQGKLDDALESYQNSLNIFRQMDDRALTADLLNCIGNVYFESGDLHRALEKGKQSLSMLEAIGNKTGVAQTLLNVGNIYEKLGDFHQALSVLERCLQIWDDVGHDKMKMYLLYNIGEIYTKTGNHTAALNKRKQSLEMAEKMSDQLVIALSWHGIAMSYYYDPGLAIQEANEQEQSRMHTILKYLLKACSLLRKIKDDAGDVLEDIAKLKQTYRTTDHFLKAVKKARANLPEDIQPYCPENSLLLTTNPVD